MAKIVGFNYEVLESKDRRPAEEHAAAIRGLMKSTAEAVVEIGRRLRQVHKAIGANKFQAWIKAEFRISQSVASNYMQAAAEFGGLDCLDRFQQSAIFDLGRANVPPKAVEQAISEARSGKAITRKRAHQIIATHQSSGELSPMMRDAARRLRSSLTAVADHVDELLSLPQEDVDVLIDQLLSIATQLRMARRPVIEGGAKLAKKGARRELATVN